MGNKRNTKVDIKIFNTPKYMKNLREQQRTSDINNTIRDISDFLVGNDIVAKDNMRSKINILKNTLNYIKNVNEICPDDFNCLQDISNCDDSTQLTRINLCYSQEDAAKMVGNIVKIWDEQTGKSTNPWFYRHLDRNPLNNDIDNLDMIYYEDIFDLLDHTIDWDRHLTYIEVSFVHANPENFKKIIRNEIQDIYWNLTGVLKNPNVYRV